MLYMCYISTTLDSMAGFESESRKIPVHWDVVSTAVEVEEGKWGA